MKAYGGLDVQVHVLFTSALVGVVSFTPLLLYPRGKGPWYPLNIRLGEPQSRFERYGEVKILD
jgi:hypothetical protein